LSILHFAVFNEIKATSANTPKFDKPYFICPNQFWAHKNQALILKAIQQLKSIDLPFYVVFTGRMFDPRNPSFFQDSIEPLLSDVFIENNIKMLGFIDRDLQIDLIKNSLAIIQPSRFEGWSTVIEDGMYFNLPILASNLKVNIEQLGEQGQYFDPDDENGLAKLMLELLEIGKHSVEYNYREKQKAFATDFLKIINS
jgi:glycosyltransferase involved in cell wall biosynthesis